VARSVTHLAAIVERWRERGADEHARTDLRRRPRPHHADDIASTRAERQADGDVNGRERNRE